MRLLLDTHIFLWYVSGDPKLPTAFRAAIQSASNETSLSVASVWEAVIKQQIGKLPLPAPAVDYLVRQRSSHGIAPLSVDEESIRAFAILPPLHRDPFDRLIIAQAFQHGLTVVTVDAEFHPYGVPLLPPT